MDETERQAQAMADAAAEAAEADDDDDDDAEGEAGAEGGGATTTRVQPGLYISTPPVLKERIETEAAAAGVSARVFVRDLLAKMWGLTLPEARSRTKYASEEEKATAQKEKRVARADLIKQLLAEHRAKQSGSGDAVVAEPELVGASA